MERIDRLDQLLSGSFRLVVRQTFPGAANRDQLRIARAGETTHPADGEVTLWVMTDERGNIIALRSKTVTLPERQLWSETQFVRRSHGMVFLRHHAACRDESLTPPPPSIKALLLDFGGPLPPFSDMGFTQISSGPPVYAIVDGDMERVLTFGESQSARTFRAVSRDPDQTIWEQSQFTIEPAEPADVMKPLLERAC